ncbi:hypothetical protein BOX15_Mlig029276g1 [Macrostomum lignano]|uniref:G_PROTEIN_RECEP_F2_4 domain-containing protein n=1 Tax=Macrostomum lignano TaxID=282301 RepID=A0A267FCK3_9PLAT|nr:hypothetical protein BOX15_Mlig029276g1 [Macrostomum lignano]
MPRQCLAALLACCLLASAAAPSSTVDRRSTDLTSPSQPPQPPQPTCRAHNGTRLLPRIFRKYSCVHCFQFMYTRADRVLYALQTSKQLRFFNETQFSADVCSAFVRLEPKHAPQVEDCSTMLRRCCLAAVACCRAQLATGAEASAEAAAGAMCPATWDGLHCINATASGSSTKYGCPTYLPSANPNNTFSIQCTEDGTWETKTSRGVVWESTNYMSCFSNSLLEWDIIFKKISLSFYCVSICFLLPAIGIFLGYESLRKQQRVVIHVNLFLALTLDAALSIATTKLYHIDVNERSLRSLESASQAADSEADSVLHSGGIGCILLSVLHRTMQSAMFMWIFVEGFYLHRLLIRAFDREKSLWTYYVLGWGTAVLINSVYCILRAVLPQFSQLNNRCWISDAQPLEWLKDGANLLCILLNVIFFINILRILLKKLNSNPNDTNNYKRAFKATCILVPLFGLQWLLMMYRQDRKVNAAIIAYRIAQATLRGSHGAIVATVFCFANNEVTTLIRKSMDRRGFGNNRLSRPSIDNRPTVYSSVPPRDSIPMGTLPSARAASLSSAANPDVTVVSTRRAGRTSTT